MRTGWNKSWQTCWKQSLTPGLEGAYNGRGWTVGWLFFLPKRSFHCATLATCVPPCRHDQIVADHPPIHDFQRCSFIYSFSLYYRTSQPLREISSLRMNRPFSMGKIIKRREKKTYFVLSFFFFSREYRIRILINRFVDSFWWTFTKCIVTTLKKF